jgi:hypothetical protein
MDNDVTDLLTQILAKLTNIEEHLETVSGDTGELSRNSSDHRLGLPPYSPLSSRK